MKLITIGIILASALLFGAHSQTPKSVAIKKVPVTAQTIASLGTNKSYVIDLTRKGTVYDVAAGINSSRVQVRTSTGKLVSLPDLVNKAGANGKKLASGKNLLLGTVSDVRALKSLGGFSKFRPSRVIMCDGLFCYCEGDDDCGKMLEPGGQCPEGSIVTCSGSGDTAQCLCIRL